LAFRGEARENRKKGVQTARIKTKKGEVGGELRIVGGQLFKGKRGAVWGGPQDKK